MDKKNGTPESTTNTIQPQNSITLTDRISLAAASIRAPQLVRVLEYIARYPFAETYAIARGAGAGYPPEPIRKLNILISQFGLKIKKYPPLDDRTNNFGEQNRVHRWAVVDLLARG